MKRLFILAALVGCHRDRFDDATEKPTPSELDTFAATLAAAAPAVQIVVEQHGKVILDRAYGVIDLENQVPATPESIFPIGLLSEQFGAAAILQLVEAKKLSLDDKISTWMPEIPRASSITVRQLLQHTSGIVDFQRSSEWPCTTEPIVDIESMSRAFACVRTSDEPGASWGLSASNYMLVGAIVHKVSRTSLAAYLAENVFARANLTHTRICAANEIILHRAHGYERAPYSETAQPLLVPAAASKLTEYALVGGICSTARDLLQWQHALEDGAIVSAASYKEMTTPGTLADGSPIHFGFGLSMLRVADHVRVMRSGTVAGFTSELEHFTDDDLRIALLSNGPGGLIATPIVNRLLHIAPARAVPIPAAAAALLRTTVIYNSPHGTMYFDATQDRLAIRADGSDYGMLHLGDLVFETSDHRWRLRFELTNGNFTRVFSAEEDAIDTLKPSPVPVSSQ